MTAEDLAPYGIGEPDADGWFPDYRPLPPSLKPANDESSAASGEGPTIDTSWLAITQHWRIVVAELMERGVDLYDPAVRARPWPGVRTLIFSLLDSPTRLREALTRR